MAAVVAVVAVVSVVARRVHAYRVGPGLRHGHDYKRLQTNGQYVEIVTVPQALESEQCSDKKATR